MEENNKDIIKELSVRDTCRDKLPVFFGSRDNYQHGLKEVIANAIDEISNNFEEGTICVELHEDLKTISVTDTGRGIPINMKTSGKPNYVLLFETLFSGTNFDNNDNGKIAVGTNGCGTCVLNHTSELFKVEVAREGGIYELIYEDGGNFKSFKKIGESKEHYTKMTFRLDTEVYTNVKYQVEELKEICKNNSAVNNKITIIFKHLDEEIKFHYDNLEDYFNEITKNKTSKNIIGINKQFNTDGENNWIEILLATSSDPVQQSYLNSNYLCNGGSINEGAINGVKLFVNKFCKENKLLDKKLGNISNNDIEESISFLVSINSSNVEYENQIKMATSKKLYKQITQDYMQDILEIFKTENPKEFDKFVKHILQVQKFNGKAQENKAKLKKKLSEKVDSLGNRINGLIDCKAHGKDAEIFICEGKSALGSVVLARNPRTQAAIAIRGKILNCLKANYDEIFKNEIIIDLIKALGCGIQTDKKNKDLETFDIKNLRFGKVILAADADPDGQNIICLLLTMIYRLMPSLISEGVIYIANTPLYEITLSDEKMIYIFSENEKEEELKKLGNKKYKIARCKGLGELDAETMSVTAMHPETRNITKVSIGQVEDMIKAFDDFMGTDVTNRKAYIENHLNKYIDNID